MNQTPSKVYLIDGSGYIFRAFYAVAPLTTKEGFPTNALYGFTRMLGKLLKAATTDQIVMVFDAGKKTFRNDLYEAYKANRAECPADLVPQMPVFREISSALGLPVIQSPGFEADDIIGTLSTRLSAMGTEVCIITGDKDICQLVNEKVSIWDTMKDKKFGIEGVIEKFGVTPDKVVDVLALMGDTSDNIPGLAGVGPKTATQLVQVYGSIENIIAQTDAIRVDSSIRGREKLADNIQQNQETLRLCKKLVEILCEAPFPGSDKPTDELIEFCTRKKANKEEVETLFAKLEFTSLLKELNLTYEKKEHTKAADISYVTVFKDKIPSLISELQKQPRFAFDLETTSLDPHAAEIVGVSLCWDDKTAYYIPTGHKHADNIDDQIAWPDLAVLLQPIFTDTSKVKIGQNLKYDLGVLFNQKFKVAGPFFDTMVAAYLVNPERGGGFNMTTLAAEYLGCAVIEYESLENITEGFQAVSIKDATEYSAEDSHVTWRLANILEPLLKEKELESVAQTIEMPLVPILAQMELLGVKIDTAVLSKMSDEFAVELEQIRERIVNMVGEEFNLNSPKQLGEILFNKLQISTKGVRKTKTGFSTDASVLELLAERHEVPAEILRHRTIFKLKSTYVDSLPQNINPITGRVHAKFNQTVTATGRLSSSEPNLQNIPIQSKEGAKIRTAFVGEPGNVILSADYSQIELRVLAHMSGDVAFIDAFVHDTDIHAKTAREIFHVPPILEVTSEQRRVGKTLNFGIIYGMSGFRLAKELGVPIREADAYIQNYFAQYPAVKKLFADLEQQAQTKHFVTTAFGRKRFINPADFSDRDKGFLSRIAVNAPIQGTAADIVKLAMIKIDDAITAQKLPLRLISQVHDELVFEVPERDAASSAAFVKEQMEAVVSFKVPLKVEVGIGRSWGEAH